MRDAARSIPTNIAEGCGRSSRSEFAHFLTIAAGSATELAYPCELARDLGLLPPEAAARLTDRVSSVRRMLAGLLKTVESEKRPARSSAPGASVARTP